MVKRLVCSGGRVGLNDGQGVNTRRLTCRPCASSTRPIPFRSGRTHSARIKVVKSEGSLRQLPSIVMIGNAGSLSPFDTTVVAEWCVCLGKGRVTAKGKSRRRACRKFTRNVSCIVYPPYHAPSHVLEERCQLSVGGLDGPVETTVLPRGYPSRGRGRRNG